jgi:hypothetical protein
MDKNHNLSELMSFLQANQKRTLGGKVLLQYAFTALVTYYSSKTITFETSVTVDTGYESGKVKLADNDQCPSDKFHLDFKPEYQSMHFDRESNILIITGDSPKMGSYKVSISALAPLASI